MQEFAAVEYPKAVAAMRSTDHPVTAIASGSELFFRFITLEKIDAAVSSNSFVIISLLHTYSQTDIYSSDQLMSANKL